MPTPQRILISALALVALACSTHTARAADAPSYSKQLDKSIPVATNTSVTIENMAGEVNVTQGGTQLEVHANVVAGGDDQAIARALADTVRLDVSRENGLVLVHVHYPVNAHDRYQYRPTQPAAQRRHGFSLFGMHFGYGESSFDYQGHRVRVYRGKGEGVPLHVDLQIRLPAGTHASIDNKVGRMHAKALQADLSMKTASGDIDAQGVTGSLTMHSGSGDIEVADIKGALSVHTGSGDVQLHRVQGGTEVGTGSGDIDGGDVHGERVNLQTGSGDITLKNLSGDLKAETGSGDIGLRDLSTITKAHIGSGSGDVNLAGDLSNMKDFEIRSGSGDISLVSAQPPAVHLDIQGSDIGVHWTGLRNIESGRRHFRADVGDASGNGHISTGSGDVSLRQ